MTASYEYNSDGIPDGNSNRPLKIVGFGCGALTLVLLLAAGCIAVAGGSSQDTIRTTTHTVMSTVTKATTRTVTSTVTTTPPEPTSSEPSSLSDTTGSATYTDGPASVDNNTDVSGDNDTQMRGFLAPAPAPVVTPEPAPAPGAYYQNCSDAKAAGAAPLYRGSPGYRPGLDGDNDGVACER